MLVLRVLFGHGVGTMGAEGAIAPPPKGAAAVPK